MTESHLPGHRPACGRWIGTAEADVIFGTSTMIALTDRPGRL